MIARALSALAGVWLMASPGVLGYGGTARGVDIVAGTLIAATAIVAVAEVTRPVRWVGLVLGLWLVVAAWLWPRPAAARLTTAAAGAAVAALSCVQGPRRHRFGGGWRAVWGDGGGDVDA